MKNKASKHAPCDLAGNAVTTGHLKAPTARTTHRGAFLVKAQVDFLVN